MSKPLSDNARKTNSFQLPDNSAFVGNSIDILPEFVIEGDIKNHYVMSATNNNSVYYLANIEIDSRDPLNRSRSATTVATEYPGTTPTKPRYRPGGTLYLRGAGIFFADNIKVVLDPVDSGTRVESVELGCTDSDDEFGAEEQFVYRFINSEFRLLHGVKGPLSHNNAALDVRCSQKTGQVRLTMKNTKTVISVLNRTPTLASSQGSGVLFSISLSPRENVLSFVDSTCNSVVDQAGNDLSVNSANPWHSDKFMGSVYYDSSYCPDIKIINGAFGLKDGELAWGWIPFKFPDQHPCSSDNEKRYRAGFASVSAWLSAGVDVACHCASSTSTSSTVSPQPAYTSAMLFHDEGNTSRLIMNHTGTLVSKRLGPLENLTTWEKIGVGFGIAGELAVTQVWFHLSQHIKRAWIRYTSQALAATLGLGLPMLQLVPKCINGLRAGGHAPLINTDLSGDPNLFDPRKM
ncbi:hypothetical protein [Endozoicomonas sp. 4G]|uniref:hypothetical protein n=1 Tax=Endozoicomonas sp. 4G TaxID=2872754 RepID=UPI0020789072|nr:hypothetical protein [Endozoicomonas sp. 4G]